MADTFVTGPSEQEVVYCAEVCHKTALNEGWCHGNMRGKSWNESYPNYMSLLLKADVKPTEFLCLGGCKCIFGPFAREDTWQTQDALRKYIAAANSG